MRNICTPDCPDRCPDPNCHMTCSKYLEALAEHREIQAKLAKERDTRRFTADHARKLRNHGFATKLR